MDDQLTNLQRLCDIILSKWTKIFDFQYLVESAPSGIKAGLKVKERSYLALAQCT